MRGWIAVCSVAWALTSSATASDEVPEALAPFGNFIGGWKGTAAPSANRVKGWSESHGWAWKFDKGKPIGMTVAWEGDRALTKGTIGHDPATGKYKLEGTDAAGKAVAYLGAFSPDGKTLTFDRVGATPEGKERLVVRPNSNKIRYTLQIDRQEPGAPQFKNVITVGLTKDGEAFAAGAGGADLPKCIMTGGAAGLTVSYNGKSYPVCCTGCRDEFNDNPEKYAKIADLAAKSAPAQEKKPGAAPGVRGKDDGSFDDLIDATKPKKEPMPPKEAAKAKPAGGPAAEAKPARAKDDPATLASRALQFGQNLEKAGKKAQALVHYQAVVKDFPGTEAAKTAAARIKALGEK